MGNCLNIRTKNRLNNIMKKYGDNEIDHRESDIELMNENKNKLKKSGGIPIIALGITSGLLVTPLYIYYAIKKAIPRHKTHSKKNSINAMSQVK